jgi:alkylation response protein AidB-like acyl-CoA dehydrogenase
MPLDLSFTPEQDLARDTLRRLLADVAPPGYVLACDLEHRPPREAFEALARDGWLGIGIDDAYGGSGGGPIDLAIALEEIGRAHLDLALWVFRNLSHGGAAIGRYGTDAQRGRYLPAIARGECSLAFALTEPDAGSDAAAITTTALRQADGSWRLTGQKWFTSGFRVADLVLVVARSEPGSSRGRGITTFLVETGLPGITATPLETLGTWSLGTAAVHLDDVRVPGEAVLGTVGEGWAELRTVLELERLCLSAARLGAAQAALEDAISYAKVRHQFGRPIGSFQAVSHTLADMATRIEAARGLVYRLAWLMAEDRPRTREAAMVKLFVSETYQHVAQAGVQVLGGYGYTMEAPMARHYRDAKLGTIGGGTSEIQRGLIARELGLPA